jgi:peptidyl-prolyl cis-trans isomerase SurA
MRLHLTSLLLFASCIASAVIIDRIAVIVENRIVKESDIKLDIRVTSFLNNENPDFSLASQRKALNRLIDQVFIRREIELGDYPTATLQQADQQLESVKKERFKTEAAFRQALRRYDLTELDLRTQFQWQLTVLRFIDVRFKPALLVTDDEIEKYYREHAAALRREYPGKSLDNLRDRIREILTDEKVNQQFFGWLDEQRKNTKVQFREASLR